MMNAPANSLFILNLFSLTFRNRSLPLRFDKVRKQLSEFLDQRISSALMWILIVVMMASPAADAHPRIGAALAILVLGTILVGATRLGSKRIVLLVGIPLSGVWVMARLLEEFGDGKRPYEHLAHFFGLAVSCTVLLAMFHRIRHTPRVTSSVISEAATVYLIIAIAFSQLYWILNRFLSPSFSQVIAASDSSFFLYFSMETLTSVGFGGIVAINPYVRFVAAFESMTGVFFIAVVVSRLVSAYHPQSDRSESKSHELVE
jgi:hypothetical protein